MQLEVLMKFTSHQYRIKAIEYIEQASSQIKLIIIMAHIDEYWYSLRNSLTLCLCSIS